MLQGIVRSLGAMGATQAMSLLLMGFDQQWAVFKVHLSLHQPSFIIKATYDALPSSSNLHLWYEEGPACLLCAGQASLKHILVCYQTILTQEIYTWCHNQVLKCLAAVLESKRVATNAMPLNNQAMFRRKKTFITKDRNGGPGKHPQTEIGRYGWTSARASHPRLQRQTCV